MAVSDILVSRPDLQCAASDINGAGIDLATVQRMIVKHGGEMRSEERPGAGVNLYFTLPA